MAVMHDLENVRVTTDKECGRIPKEFATYRSIIVAGITANMLNEHIGSFNRESVYFRVTQTDITSIDITTHGAEGSESLKLLCNLKRAYVARMPHLVTLGKVLCIAFIPMAMGIREEADALHNWSPTLTLPLGRGLGRNKEFYLLSSIEGRRGIIASVAPTSGLSEPRSLACESWGRVPTLDSIYSINIFAVPSKPRCEVLTQRS